MLVLWSVKGGSGTTVVASLLASALARLPVQLIMPVVACILPAFILLGVVPLFVAVMPSLGTPTIP